ncbi:MAG: hypothetical protein U5K54_15155 [Cytophagales bacterium]|nr:hypothetical protein [Cytophagales bacterium]
MLGNLRQTATQISDQYVNDPDGDPLVFQIDSIAIAGRSRTSSQGTIHLDALQKSIQRT